MEGEIERDSAVSYSKGNANPTYIGGAVVLSILILAGSILYASGSLGMKLDSLNSDISKIRASLTSSGALGDSGQQDGTQPTVAKPSPSPSPSVDTNLEGKLPRGDANAPVTIVEYSDFQCPFCARAAPTVKQVLQDYEGQVKVYYKHFPLNSIHPNAQKAAEASECAADQGKFWEYHDKLFENQNALGSASLKQYATDLGLDSSKFDSCLDGGSKASIVNADLQEGISNGVGGTPAFFINGEMISGAQPYAVFKQVIDAQLN